jgi:DNA-binding NarL/FixJ family response regulator
MIPTEKPVKVLIADSQILITESLKYILNAEGSFCTGTAVSGKKEIIIALQQEDIPILIIDPSLIDLNSILEIKDIKNSFPDLKVIVLTNIVTKSDLLELNAIGINNVILKTADREEIFEAINATVKGKKYYSNDLLEILLEVNEKKSSGENGSQLTYSEMEVVRLISEGLTTKEIAARKFISFHTVITHRKNIFRKLGVSSVSELIMYAIKAGWINMIEYHI